jgi:hypothetical protein
MLALVVPLLSGGELAAQAISARALVAAPKYSLQAGDLTERVDGLWAGLALDLAAGPVSVSGSATRGRLTPPSVETGLARDVGELDLIARGELRPWLALHAGYTARAFSSAAGRQRWDMLGGGLTASRELGVSGVRAFAGLTYLAVVRTSQEPDPTAGLGSDVGVSLAPDASPVAVLLSYHLERFFFPTAAARSEQFEGLSLSVGARVQWLGGRWRLAGRR